MAIEINNVKSEMHDITEIKEPERIDLSTAVEALEQTEIGGKKGKEEALQHIKKGETRAVINYLDNYEGLDSEVAISLIKHNELKNVEENIEKFCPLNNDLQILLIKKGETRFVAENVNLFTNTSNETAKNLLKYGNGAEVQITRGIENFEGLDNTIATAILESNITYISYSEYDERYGDYVTTRYSIYEFLAEKLSHFNGLYDSTAKKLIRNGGSIGVIRNLKSFQELKDNTYQELVTELIKLGEDRLIIKNLENLKGIDHVKLIKKLIELGTDIIFLAENMEKFNNEGKKYLKEILIENKYLKDQDGKRKQFKELSKEEFLQKLYITNVINEIKEKLNTNEFKLQGSSEGEYLNTIKGSLNDIPITIKHIKGRINKIKIDDLKIDFTTTEEAFGIIKIINNSIKYKKTVGKSNNNPNNIGIIYTDKDLITYPILSKTEEMEKLNEYISTK